MNRGAHTVTSGFFNPGQNLRKGNDLAYSKLSNFQWPRNTTQHGVNTIGLQQALYEPMGVRPQTRDSNIAENQRPGQAGGATMGVHQ